MGDVQRAEVAGDIFPDMRIAEVFIIGGRRTDLQGSPNTDCSLVTRPATGLARFTVSSNMSVRVAGFKLDLRQALEQVAGADPAFADPLVGHQLRIEVADGATGERFAVYSRSTS